MKGFIMLSAVRSFQKHPPSHERAWVCSLSCNLCGCSRPSSRSSVAAVAPMVIPDVPDPSPVGGQQSPEPVNTAQAELCLALGPGRGRATPSFVIRKPREKVNTAGLQGSQSFKGSAGAGVRSKEWARADPAEERFCCLCRPVHWGCACS